MPLAAAAPELLVVFVAALLLALLLVSVQLYQNGKQARSFALNLPVVAIPVVSAVDWLIAFNVQAARYVDNALGNFLVLSITSFGRMVVFAFNTAGAAILFLIRDTAAQANAANNLARHIEFVELPAVGAALDALGALRTVVSDAVRGFVVTTVAAATLPILARLSAAEGVNAAQQQTLDTYRPMWQQLAAVPGGAATAIALLQVEFAALRAQVGVLEAELSGAQNGVSALERQIAAQSSQLARLAAVGVLAGAGVAVVAELVRIAENPCEVCPGLNLSDLEGRVASMELSGV